MNYNDIQTIARVYSAETILSELWSRFHEEQIQNFNLLAGYIYSEDDLRKLIREKRPTFQYNLFMPIITRIIGGFKNSLIGVDFLPKEPKDTELAKVVKEINDFILYQANDIEYEISKAFLNAVVGRIGWIKQDFIYSNEFPEGMVDIKNYPPIRIKIDPNSTRRDLKDCNFISDSGWYSYEEIIQIYAQNNPELEDLVTENAKAVLGESSLDKIKNTIKSWVERIFDFSTEYYGSSKGFDTLRLKKSIDIVNVKEGLFKVIDFYEKRLVNQMTIITDEGSYDISDLIKKSNQDLNKTDWYDRDKLDFILRNYEGIDYKIVERKVQKIFQISIVPALNLKLYDDIHPLSNFKFVPIFCYDFHPSILETKSIIDLIKDPVRSANHRRNTMLTYITRVAHGGWITEESAIKDHLDDFLSNEIGGIKRVRDGALSQGRIKQIEVPQMPTALDKLQLEDMEFVKIISGVRDNALASSESAQESGVLFRQKVMQSELMQEWIADNGQSAMLLISKNNLEYIQNFFTDERVIRIVNPENGDFAFLPINKEIIMPDGTKSRINEISKGKYDVIVSKTPYGKAQREIEFNKLIALSQLIASINPAYIDPVILIKASGLKFADEMIRHIQNINNQNLIPEQNQDIKNNARNLNLDELSKTLSNAEDSGLSGIQY